MASLMLSALLLVPAFLGSAQAALPDGRPNANIMPNPSIPKVSVPDGPITDRNGSALPPLTKVYLFDQLIDHNDTSKGTFKQRYWHTWEWYKPGGCIIITTPGEGNADGYEGYLTNTTINGQIAQQQNCATIVMEHRFYGESNPYDDLSVKSLQVHTIQQAVEDLDYFAKNVKLAMPGGDNVPPGKAPWVLVGGSYAGALTAWTMTNKPDTFWAGYASSGVVEALVDYWAYFEPIRQYMAKNCSADVEAVIAHVDDVFTNGNDSAKADLKATFGMENVTHNDDAAGALRNNLWDWQSLQPTSGGGAFFEFCDALEVKNGKSAPAAGWGLAYALPTWGSYFKNSYLPSLCGDQDAESCLGTYDTNQTYWTNTTVNNAGRSWEWIVCNEVGYLQEGPPAGQPAIVSRLIQPIYDERQCQQYFPEAFSKPPTPDTNATNDVYHGWNVKVDRLFVANGQRDPWRDVTLSADGLNVQSTPTQPIVVGDGFHCSDLGTSSAKVDPTIAHVQAESLKYMKTWLAAWKPSNSSSSSRRAARDLTPGIQLIGGSKPTSAWSRGSGTL